MNWQRVTRSSEYRNKLERNRNMFGSLFSCLVAWMLYEVGKMLLFHNDGLPSIEPYDERGEVHSFTEGIQ